MFTTFLFIPLLGSRFTFLIIILLLLFIASVGLAKFHQPTYLCCLLLVLMVPLGFTHQATSSNYLYQTESEYNIISVKQEPSGRRLLKLNDNFGFHSLSLDPKTKLSYAYYDYYLFAQLLVEAENTLILGNGAGTSMMQIAHFFNTKIDAVEIDPKLTKIGKDYFGLDLKNDRLSLFYQDARVFLLKNNKKYDVINMDIYAGNHYIPFHVATVEFFRLVKRALSEDGILVVNIPFYAMDNKLGRYYLNTITTVFPNSYICGHMLYAFETNLDKEKIVQKVKDRKTPEVLSCVMKKVLSNLKKAVLFIILINFLASRIC